MRVYTRNGEWDDDPVFTNSTRVPYDCSACRVYVKSARRVMYHGARQMFIRPDGVFDITDGIRFVATGELP